MKRPNYGLIGVFAGLLADYLAESGGLLPVQGFGARLVFASLIGAIMGNIVERVRHRSA